MVAAGGASGIGAILVVLAIILGCWVAAGVAWRSKSNRFAVFAGTATGTGTVFAVLLIGSVMLGL